MNKPLVFLLGISAAFSALIIQTIFIIIFPSLADLASFDKISSLMLIAIIIEEILKFTLIWKIFNNFKKQTNIFTCSLLLGFGFAVTEIAFNIFGNSQLIFELFFSYLGLLLIHIFTSAFYGIYFLRKKSQVIWQNITILGIGLLLHFLFNLSVFYEINIILLDAILAIILAILIKSVFLPKK